MALTITAAGSPNQFLAGINARLAFSVTSAGVTTTTAFPMEQVDLDVECDWEDVTHSEAGGWKVLLAGLRQASMTITFVYDLANNPNVSPRSLQPGLIAAVHLVLDANASPGLPNPALAEDFNGQVALGKFSFPTGPKSGAVRVKVEAKSTGVFNLPVA